MNEAVFAAQWRVAQAIFEQVERLDPSPKGERGWDGADEQEQLLWFWVVDPVIAFNHDDLRLLLDVKHG